MEILRSGGLNAEAGVARLSFRQAVLRGLHRRCPNCGRGPMFRSRFRVLDDCPVCHLTYYPETGYYVGAMYLTFIAAFLLVTPIYVASFILDPQLASMAAWKVAVIWAVAGGLLPLVIMPYAYGLWLALDFWLNPWEAGKPPELLSR